MGSTALPSSPRTSSSPPTSLRKSATVAVDPARLNDPAGVKRPMMLISAPWREPGAGTKPTLAAFPASFFAGVSGTGGGVTRIS